MGKEGTKGQEELDFGQLRVLMIETMRIKGPVPFICIYTWINQKRLEYKILKNSTRHPNPP